MTKKSTINKIQAIINKSKELENSYFFKPPSSDSQRRYYEEKHTIPQFEWVDGKDIYTAEFNVECSCKNIYAKGYYTKNGNKTNLTAIKNSLKRLQAN